MGKEKTHKYEIHPVPKHACTRDEVEKILNEKGKNGWRFAGWMPNKTLLSRRKFKLFLILEAEQ